MVNSGLKGLKHHFTSLKTVLISPQQRVLERNFHKTNLPIHGNFFLIFKSHQIIFIHYKSRIATWVKMTMVNSGLKGLIKQENLMCVSVKFLTYRKHCTETLSIQWIWGVCTETSWCGIEVLEEYSRRNAGMTNIAGGSEHSPAFLPREPEDILGTETPRNTSSRPSTILLTKHIGPNLVQSRAKSCKHFQHWGNVGSAMSGQYIEPQQCCMCQL